MSHYYSNMVAPEAKPSPKLVVIDDDTDFLGLIKACAESMGITAVCFSSLEQLPTLRNLATFDVALIDYYLEDVLGLEIAEYLDIFAPDLPVLLVSGSDVAPSPSLIPHPRCVKKFVIKGIGPYAILNRVLGVLADHKSLQSLRVNQTS
jgi:DNA-binding NtrC family response regulator